MIVSPTSKFQEQFWLLNMLAPKSTAYNIPIVLKLESVPEINILERALNLLIDRHDSLRTHFDMVNIEFNQVVNPVGSCWMPIEVLEVNVPVSENVIPSEIMEEVHGPFNLSTAPLLRVKLYKYHNAIYLTIVFHHIIVDLHSKDIFAKELSELYNSLENGRSSNLTEKVSQYTDFSQWHNDWLKGEQAGKMLLQWTKELPKASTLLNLPFDKESPTFPTLFGKRKHFTLGSKLSSNIQEFAQKESTYPFLVLLSAYAILLNRLSQQNTVVIGVPLSNRKKEEYKDTFGCFVNVMPISIDFSSTPTENEVRQQIRRKMLLAHRVQEIPFLEIINSNTEKRDPSINPYFQT